MDGTDSRTGETPSGNGESPDGGGLQAAQAPQASQAAQDGEPPEGTAPGQDTSPDQDTAPDDDGTPGALTARHRAVLALERRGWPSPGAKERAVREQLGLAPVRYYQLLNALLDDPRALAHDPVTVNRLRRIRETRRAER